MQGTSMFGSVISKTTDHALKQYISSSIAFWNSQHTAAKTALRIEIMMLAGIAKFSTSMRCLSSTVQDIEIYTVLAAYCHHT